MLHHILGGMSRRGDLLEVIDISNLHHNKFTLSGHVRQMYHTTIYSYGAYSLKSC